MQRTNGSITLSATDLVGHLSCRYLTRLDIAAANGVLERPKAWDPLLQILRERGARHEQGFVNHLRSRGFEVWGAKQCAQLWRDIIRAGKDYGSKGHFLGSVVYIAAEENTAAIPRWLLIDGQQRMTTLTLIIAALRDRLRDQPSDPNIDTDDGLPTPEELEDYYLRNRHGKADRRHKLRLRRTDFETLSSMVGGEQLPDAFSERISENFRFLSELVAGEDPRIVYNGIKKLIVIDVSLARGQDDPQMIFESLNSTGVDLTQADLIRNFVLMRLDEETQSSLYQAHWQPIEVKASCARGSPST